MQPGAQQPRPVIKRHRRFLRPLLASLVLTILLTAFTLAVLPALGKGNGFNEHELKLGSTSFRFECDDDAPDQFFEHETWDVTDGEPTSGRRIAIGLPLGTVTLAYNYEPLEAIRKRIPTTVEGLAALLDSKNRFEVFAAAHALYENPTNAAPALPKLLAAAEKNIHLAGALEPIAQAAPRESLPTLIIALSSTNAQLRYFCTQILSQLGTNALPAVPAILAALKSNAIEVEYAAYALLKITGDCSPVIPKLRDELKFGPPDRRINLLRILTDLGLQGEPALPEVIAILESSKNSTVRANAFKALSHITNDETIILPHIRAALAGDAPNDITRIVPPKDPGVLAAINALSRLGAHGVPLLIPLYQGTNGPVKAAAGRALARIGPPAALACDAISAELKSTCVNDVALACEIVSNLGTNATPLLPALTNLLFVPNLKIRAVVAVTFSRLGHCNDTVIRILADSIPNGELAPLIFKTVHPIIQTNSAALAVFDQRLAINRKAARSYKAQSQTFTAYPPAHDSLANVY